MNLDIERLRAACERDLGDPAGWPALVGYPNSLALCIIEAIYVTGARYLTVEKVVQRYRAFRAGQGGDADADGAPQLLTTVEQLGGPQRWAADIGNRRPTSTAKNAPLRSEALTETARGLVDLGIRTTEDLRAAADDKDLCRQARAAWCAVPGQKSGFTWNYLVMLAQRPDVAVDRTVAAYVAREVGDDSARAAELLSALAESAGWNAGALHHAIWRFEAGRPRELPSSA
ncbi:heme peroxidase [Mycobacterium sp. OTB74]|jgi:hypothetical protein|uniref:heme peroxidase n=1 Tax=Mycobacterium sp. OTB74 TaxID=1853452 RepID=UPI002475EAFC|nr:heme peroxidase [Mycobacterium sp. OTB74]MDH6244190.1 hypothetical protein [Mycobacterium sp. OTB74]